MLKLKNVSKINQKNGAKLLKNVSFDLSEKKIFGFYDATGESKNIFIRLLTGLETPDKGEVIYENENINKFKPSQREIAYIPSDLALYPHMTVKDNIEHPLKLKGISRKDRIQKIESISKRLGISDLITKKPDKISGGQQRRVALARGLVQNSRYYLLDDPLTGLDYKIREQLVEDLIEMQQETDSSFLFASSNPLETMAIADEMLILANGEIVDFNTITELFKKPQHLTTRLSLGFPQTNNLIGKLYKKDSLLYFNINDNLLSLDNIYKYINKTHESCHLTFRPESVTFYNLDGDVEHLGLWSLIARQDIGEGYVYEASNGSNIIRIFQSKDQSAHNVGEEVPIYVKSDDILIYTHKAKLLGEG